MTPLILIVALFTIAAAGAAWALIRRRRARKLAERTAGEESERVAVVAERGAPHGGPLGIPDGAPAIVSIRGRKLVIAEVIIFGSAVG